jgi:virginiamycin B lyase
MLLLIEKGTAMFRRRIPPHKQRVWSYRPALEGLEQRQLLSFTELPLSPGSGPKGITAGPNGTVWFTEAGHDKIGRVNANLSITEFRVPTVDSGLEGITTSPDGTVWFTESDGNKLGRVNGDGSISEFDLPFPNSAPWAITMGPDHNIWFTEFSGNRVGRVNGDGTITQFQIPTAHSYPAGITTGADGNVWFTETVGKLGRVNSDGSISEFDVPNRASEPEPRGITTGPDGHIWFTEILGQQLGRVNGDGSISEFRLPRSQPYLLPNGITTGPDLNLWFTEFGGNRLGRLNGDYSISEFLLPSPTSSPYAIAAGPGGVWFTETDCVARFNVPRRIDQPLPHWGGFFAGQTASGTTAPSPSSNPDRVDDVLCRNDVLPLNAAVSQPSVAELATAFHGIAHRKYVDQFFGAHATENLELSWESFEWR